MWVAAFTGGTAVLAGWVTNLGNVRAARVQAEASAKAQRVDRVRELRRAAYLDFMERAHVAGELYSQAAYAFTNAPGDEPLPQRVDALRAELRSAYDPLMRSARVVVLEGPAEPAETAGAVLEAVTRTNRALWKVSLGEPGARDRFAEGRQDFTRCLARFVEAARAAMGTL